MFSKKSTKNQDSNELRTRASNRSQYNFYSKSTQNRSSGDLQTETSRPGSIRRRLRLFPTYIALGVIGMSLLFSLTLSSNPSVNTVGDQDSPYRKLEDYAKAVDEIMSKNISNKSKITVDTQDVETKLMDQFPELSAAALRLPVLGRKPSLIIAIEPPAILLTTRTKSYVLDKSGTVVADSQKLNQETRSSLVVVQDQSGLEITIGGQAVTKETIRFITEAIAQLSAKNYNIEQLTLPLNANQLDIKLKGYEYYIKTDIARSAQLQIGSFLAVREQLEREGLSPKEYVDVRVEEKVFYK